MNPDSQRASHSSLLHFREAEPADYERVFGLFEALQLLHVEALPKFFKAPHKDRHFRRFYDDILGDPRLYLVLAVLESKIVGYVHFGQIKRNEDIYEAQSEYVYVRQLVVDDSVRRQGLATALLGYVREFTAEQGLVDIGIDCWAFNNNARKCFEQAGFAVHQHVLWNT